MANKDIMIVISIGSNFEQEVHVEEAKRALGIFFPDITFSQALWTEPVGMESDDFLNLLAVASTHRPLADVEAILKNIEKSCGRKPLDKEMGMVKMDLDILLYDKMRLHEHDWERAYIKKLLATFPLLQENKNK